MSRPSTIGCFRVFLDPTNAPEKSVFARFWQGQLDANRFYLPFY